LSYGYAGSAALNRRLPYRPPAAVAKHMNLEARQRI
jgi:hypothetical protein